METQLISAIGMNANIPRKSMDIKKILILDDDLGMRRSICRLIEGADHLCLMGESSITPDAVEMIGGMNPDVVILCVSVASNLNGIGFIKSLKERCPNVRVLVTAMFDETLFAERALRVGAHGYIAMKGSVSRKILKAIGTICKGELFISEDISLKLITRLIRKSVDAIDISIDDLSGREMEIFQLVGRGFTTKEIAHMLKLSIFTVETHKRKIRQKLKIKDTPEMLKTAIQWMLMNNRI